MNTGKTEHVANTVRLGTDRVGRLYASRSLNPLRIANTGS
jgi:hypothetical protein